MDLSITVTGGNKAFAKLKKEKEKNAKSEFVLNSTLQVQIFTDFLNFIKYNIFLNLPYSHFSEGSKLNFSIFFNTIT